MQLEDGSRVAVVGGGPAGSFTSYFLLDLAERVGTSISVDIYEPRDYMVPGPVGCNMCGGIISESLVQMLATEGINLPSTVIQRSIDSYVLHSDVGTVNIDTPLHEMRIGAVHRGAGPKGAKGARWGSFDGHLLELAHGKGANILRGKVEELTWDNGRPRVQAKGLPAQTYDLLVGAVGINSTALKLFEGLGFQYKAPEATRTFIAEFYLGAEAIKKYFGSSMHVFLMDMPRVEFAAIIPKGEYVTLCLLGHEIDKELVDSFLNNPVVKNCFPPEMANLTPACQCGPKIAVKAMCQPFGDRVVLIGDCGVTRLYKDGIGASYRTAKAVAVTAIFDGISNKDFQRHYWTACQVINKDNQFGLVVFFIVSIIRKLRFVRLAVLRMTGKEQVMEGKKRAMSMVLWDTFTGSAPYRNIFWRASQFSFLSRLITEVTRALVVPGSKGLN
ncbi:MAG: hypothetical protein Q7R34_01260 [Dehalococcoidia bacterium]|nr:hypothetical protein [Dehalococcoidia bacterium]